jgi:hypothetical protein
MNLPQLSRTRPPKKPRAPLVGLFIPQAWSFFEEVASLSPRCMLYSGCECPTRRSVLGGARRRPSRTSCRHWRTCSFPASIRSRSDTTPTTHLGPSIPSHWSAYSPHSAVRPVLSPGHPSDESGIPRTAIQGCVLEPLCTGDARKRPAIEGGPRRAFPQLKADVVSLAGLEPAASSFSAIEGYRGS